MYSDLASKTNPISLWGAFQTSAIGMALLDLNGDWIEVNPAFCDFLGYRHDEFANKNFADFTHPEDVEKSVKLFHDLVAEGRGSYQLEKRFNHRDGEIVWALLTVSYVEGETPYIAGQVQNITSRKIAEEARRKSESLFRTITENAGDLILVADANRNTVYVSPAYQHQLGYDASELVGKDCLAIVHPADREIAIQALREMVGSGNSKIVELRAQDKSGQWHHLQSHGAIIREHSDREPRFVVVSRLLDDQIKAQQQRKYEDELRAAVLHSSKVLTNGAAEETIPSILATVARSLSVDRVLVIEEHTDEHSISLCYSWQKPEVPQITSALFSQYPTTAPEFREWIRPVMEGKHVVAYYPDPNKAVTDLLASIEMQTILAVPIIIGDNAWGCLGVDSSEFKRQWSEVEISILHVLANLIGTTIIRDRNQKMLRESEGQLKLLLDSTAEAIYGIDLHGRCTFSNNSCVKMLGYASPDQLLGQKIHDLIHVDARGEIMPLEECTIHNALLKGEGTHAEDAIYRRADGSCFPVEYWSYPIVQGGDLKGCVITFIDNTERKESEQAIRAAHRESQVFINAMPSFLIGTTSEGVVLRWNRAAKETFHLSESFVIGKTVFDCGIRWKNEDIREEILDALSQLSTYRGEAVPYERDGETRYVDLEINPIPLNEGQEGWIITGSDVTSTLLLEQQLRQAQKLEAIGQLAAGVAHEINTPIQFIGDNVNFFQQSWSDLTTAIIELNETQEFRTCKGYLQHQKEDPAIDGSCRVFKALEEAFEKVELPYLLKEVPAAISQTLEGVQRVTKIVRAMKEFSHPGNEQVKETDINRAIETTITVAKNEWKYVADVVTDLDPKLPLVSCYPGELNQVILNLLTNAAHAIKAVNAKGEKGTITIRTREHPAGVEISISDTGTGIPIEIQNRIFDPFFTTKGVGEGTGQGLSLAHSIVVKKHRGQIRFESVVGQGTTFFILLPCAVGVQEAYA